MASEYQIEVLDSGEICTICADNEKHALKQLFNVCPLLLIKILVHEDQYYQVKCTICGSNEPYKDSVNDRPPCLSLSNNKVSYDKIRTHSRTHKNIDILKTKLKITLID